MYTGIAIFISKIIVIDEAHERGINSDILLGLLKSKVETREDLKLVVMSASLDEHKFKRYFSVDCFHY